MEKETADEMRAALKVLRNNCEQFVNGEDCRQEGQCPLYDGAYGCIVEDRDGHKPADWEWYF